MEKNLEKFNLSLVKLQEKNDELWAATAALHRDNDISLATDALLLSIIDSCMMIDDYLVKSFREVERLKRG